MAESSIPQTRRCGKCGVEFPLTAEYFHKHKRDKAGFNNRCKECAKAVSKQWYEDNKEYALKWQRDYVLRNWDKTQEDQRKYRENHREETKQYNQDYRKRKPEKHAEHDRKYRERYPEKGRARQRRYRLRHPDRVKIRFRRWHQDNPDKNRLYHNKRRAKQSNLPNEFTQADWQRALTYFDNKCAVCGNEPDFWRILAMDHWQPLDGGGATIAGNIVPLCRAKPGAPSGTPSCNSSKSNKDPERWLTDRFGKRKARVILNRIRNYFEWLKSQ